VTDESSCKGNVVDFEAFRAAHTRRSDGRGQLRLFDEPAAALLFGVPRRLSARQEAHRAAMLAHLRRGAR